MSISIRKGQMFGLYNEDTESFDMLRVKTFNNRDDIECISFNTLKYSDRKIVKSSVDELKRYTRLRANALLSVSEVDVLTLADGSKLKDVVSMVFENINANSTIRVESPNIVCRQAMSDIFYTPYCKTEDNPYVGFSATQDTLPEPYKIKDMTVCDNCVRTELYDIYITDTLDSICELIGDEFDDVLSKIADIHWEAKKIKYPMLRKDTPDTDDGYCTTLKSLYRTNNFMYDVHSLLKVSEVNFKIEYDPYAPDGTEQTLTEYQKSVVQDIYKVNMAKTYIIKYDVDLDFDSVRAKYVLLLDNTGELYIVVYTKSLDEYVINVDINNYSGIQKDIYDRINKAVAFYDKYSN